MDSEEFTKKVAELKILRRQARSWRVAYTGIFVVASVISTVAMLVSYNGLSQDGPTKDAFVRALGANMSSYVVPQVQEIGSQALQHIDFQKEFSHLNTRAPEVADASVTQVKLLAQNLPDKSEKILQTNLDSALQDREAKIRAMFPSASDDKVATLMTTLTQQAQDQSAQLTHTLLAPHVDAMNGIIVDLDKIEKDDAPAATEAPTWQTVFLLTDIARADFKDADLKTTTPATVKEAKAK